MTGDDAAAAAAAALQRAVTRKEGMLQRLRAWLARVVVSRPGSNRVPDAVARHGDAARGLGGGGGGGGDAAAAAEAERQRARELRRWLPMSALLVELARMPRERRREVVRRWKEAYLETWGVGVEERRERERREREARVREALARAWTTSSEGVEKVRRQVEDVVRPDLEALKQKRPGSVLAEMSETFQATVTAFTEGYAEGKAGTDAAKPLVSEREGEREVTPPVRVHAPGQHEDTPPPAQAAAETTAGELPAWFWAADPEAGAGIPAYPGLVARAKAMEASGAHLKAPTMRPPLSDVPKELLIGTRAVPNHEKPPLPPPTQRAAEWPLPAWFWEHDPEKGLGVPSWPGLVEEAARRDASAIPEEKLAALRAAQPKPPLPPPPLPPVSTRAETDPLPDWFWENDPERGAGVPSWPFLVERARRRRQS